MSGGHTHALHVHGHSAVHELPGHLKVAGLLLFVAAVVATPARAIWAFGLYAIGLAFVAALAGIPVRFIGKRMLIEVPFLLFALLLPFVGEAPYTSFAGIRISEAGLLAAWTILAKASCGVVASILLAATTEIPEILAGMNRLRVPSAIVAIAGFMVRYLEVISDEMGRMRVAMAARGYEPKMFWQIKALATSAGALFIRSYERGERVYLAMVARGFQGTMPTKDDSPAAAPDIARALAIPALAGIVAVLALVGAP